MLLINDFLNDMHTIIESTILFALLLQLVALQCISLHTIAK